VCQNRLPELGLDDPRYEVRFAESVEELRAIQRLRFEVFNVELGEGLDESHRSGLDEDRFDPVCHHLMALDRATRRVVGTYRMQTRDMAERHLGFYSAGEFDLTGLPPRILDEAVELGRACVCREHRNRRVLFLLWKGVAAYLAFNRKRYLFGCCSLTSQDPAEGKRVMAYLVSGGYVREDLQVRPLPGWECYGPGQGYEPATVELPRLFQLYLRYGARACGPPAIDRLFKTIDYFVLWNVDDLDRDLYQMYFD
jgi:putative hemolysin